MPGLARDHPPVFVIIQSFPRISFLRARACFYDPFFLPSLLFESLPPSLWASTKLFLMRAQTHGKRKRRRKSTMERGDCKNPVFPLFLVSPPPVTAATIALGGGVKNSPFAIENGGSPHSLPFLPLDVTARAMQGLHYIMGLACSVRGWEMSGFQALKMFPLASL